MGKHRTLSLLARDGKSHSKEITIRNGDLQLHPLVKPCDGLFQVFLLTKVMWFLLAELGPQEKTKQLEREVEFARDELGFTFVDQTNNSDDVSNSVVVSAILGWAENYVVKEVSASAFQRVRHALDEMKTNHAREDTGVLDTTRHMHHRAHRFQRDINSIRPPTPTTSIQPQPAASNPASSNTTPTKASAPVVRQTRNAKRKRTSSDDEPARPVRSTLGHAGRSLEELRKELEKRHPTKRRRVEANDVVSGKGERAKQQNEGYRELVRQNAPIFRGTNTGDAETDLEIKRKLAYRLALTVVDRGGCFLGQDQNPLDAKKAFKRVMTSLKDWRAKNDKKNTTTKKGPNKSCPKRKKNSATLAEPEPAEAAQNFDDHKPPARLNFDDSAAGEDFNPQGEDNLVPMAVDPLPEAAPNDLPGADLLGSDFEDAVMGQSEEAWFQLSCNLLESESV